MTRSKGGISYQSNMQRPQRKRIGRHSRTAPPEGTDLNAVAGRVRYLGSPEHKTTLSFAGRPAPRADATLCDPRLHDRRNQVESWLAEAIRRGDCGGPWENGFPRYVWRREVGVTYEARLSNQQRGEYKGYPIDSDQCPI